MMEEPVTVKQQVKIIKNGPYLVSGRIPMAKQILVCDREGNPAGWHEGRKFPVNDTYSLCRCGGSHTKPFCDGTHLKNHFDGTENASRVPYIERAEWTDGPDIRLSDAPGFCSHARFCVRGQGIWKTVEQSADPDKKKAAIKTAADCHSGRLVIWDRESGKPIEPVFEKSIGIVEGPGE